jgi:hypothetical protein
MRWRCRELNDSARDWFGIAFEVPITPFSGTTGIADFTDRDARARRRELSRDFWQDRGVSQSATAG